MDTLAWAVGENGYIVRIGDPLLGVDEGLEAETGALQLYPNPVQDRLAIQWPESAMDSAEFELYDLQGRQAFKETIFPSNSSIDVAGIPAGVYMARMVSNGKAWSGKVLKLQ